MTSGLEDKIIAYFDGELSDVDSAELLHRVSISPEIRNIFRSHEMLRNMAHDAASAVTISPEIESSLFSKIEALAGKPTREKAVWVFSRRTAMVGALALILISGSLGYFVPKLFSGDSQSMQFVLRENLPLSNIQSAPTANMTGSRSTLGNNFKAIHISGTSEAPQNGTLAEISNYTPGGLKNKIADSRISQATEPTLETGIHEVTPRMADIHSDIGGERHSPFEINNSQLESASRFEASFQTSSGFTYPADASPIKPFADQRLSVAYHFTENNMIGIRIGSGLYQQLGGFTQSSLAGVEILSRNIETKRSFSEEIFVSHLVPVTIGAPFFLYFSLDGGIIPNGYSYGAEAGIRIPVSESIMFDAAFALSRVHSNALTSEQLLNSQSSTKPVLIEGVDIHNTLNGRLHYGLVYRF